MEYSKRKSKKSQWHITQYQDYPPRCMPYRIINKKTPLKSQNLKDIKIFPLQKDHLSPINISKISQNQKYQTNIKSYKHTVQDTVLVKQINLNKKQLYYRKYSKNKSNFIRKQFLYQNKLESMRGKIQKQNVLCKFYPTSSCSKKQTHFNKINKIINKDKLDKDNYSLHQQIRSIQSISKNQITLNLKLLKYLNYIKQNRRFHKLDQKILQIPNKKMTTISIKKGNNSFLIKQLIKKRWWLTLSIDQENQKSPNFIWSQLKEKQYFLNKTSSNIDGQMYLHNHFPKNQYLGNKKALLYNMTHYYKSEGKYVFNYLPLTFHIHSFQDQSWKQFKKTYLQKQINQLKNIWIIKPGQNSNRGKGITIHNKLEQIQKTLGLNQSIKNNLNKTYIIQQYIEKPFLYNKRKFDLRSYMLLVNINNSVKGYWYKQGYIRTSSYQYQLNDFNSFVHLTNDSIQTGCQNYGKYEDRNKISFAQFQRYLDFKYPSKNLNISKDIIPQMKKIALDSIRASLQRVKGNEKNTLPVFQIFGLDYMIDETFKPWLIQINTNPCIETSCSVIMQNIIPRMINQVFRLSLDVLFPPPQIWPESRKHNIPNLNQGFELIYDEQNEKFKVEKKNLLSNHQIGLIKQDQEIFQQK